MIFTESASLNSEPFITHSYLRVANSVCSGRNRIELTFHAKLSLKYLYVSNLLKLYMVLGQCNLNLSHRNCCNVTTADESSAFTFIYLLQLRKFSREFYFCE